MNIRTFTLLLFSLVWLTASHLSPPVAVASKADSSTAQSTPQVTLDCGVERFEILPSPMIAYVPTVPIRYTREQAIKEATITLEKAKLQEFKCKECPNTNYCKPYAYLYHQGIRVEKNETQYKILFYGAYLRYGCTMCFQ